MESHKPPPGPAGGNLCYLELSLNNRSVRNRLQKIRNQPLMGVFRVIEKAGKDRRIQGLLVNLSGFTADREYIWELRTALEHFRETGRKICCFISAADLDLYCLASAADKIVMDRQGILFLLGYAWGRSFVRNTLDKFGVGVRELRYFEYKSAAETYTRDSLSEADRKQYGEYLDDIFGLTRDTLIQARFHSGEAFDDAVNSEFLYSAKSALERGLVDYTGRQEAVLEAVRELEGAEVKTWYCYGDSGSSLLGRKREYSAARGRRLPGTARIALVYASGQTDFEQGMGVRGLAGTIRDLSEKRSVKAMVVRINSPGGSADAADCLAGAIKAAKERIPVVVSMGAVAASGGYWAAMYANHITVSPYTLTGSIGVIGSWFFDRGLNSKLGLAVDTLRRGAHSDLFAGFILPCRDLGREEMERYRLYILDLYGDFVNKAAEGRKMDAERLESLARGRVYSGLAALNAGLVDSIGGLADALRIACGLAGITGKKILCDEYPRPRFIDSLLMRFAPVSSIDRFAGLEIRDLLEDLRFRLLRNGQVMPILPAGIYSGFLSSRGNACEQ